MYQFGTMGSRAELKKLFTNLHAFLATLENISLDFSGAKILSMPPYIIK